MGVLAWIGVVVPLVAAQDEDEYGATAEVEPVEVGETELEAEEIDDLPVLGDPFRAVQALPGTVSLQSASPFVAVRGAPPAATVYYYDDIPLPAIAHVGAGPGLLHPSMVGELEFNPGVAPARYGRFTGAVISATAREASPEPFGEAELRLLDVGGVVDLPLGDHRVQASAHIGYPGLVYQLAVPETNVQYHDYFLRYEYRFDSEDSFRAVAIGSYDSVDNPPWTFVGDESATMEMQFHRLEVRFVREKERTELGTALRFGLDDSTLGQTLAVTAVSIAPRVWASYRTDAFRLRAGADFVGSFGDIDDPEGPLMGPGGSIAFELPFYAQARAREAIGLYVETAIRPVEWLEISPGLRGDLFVTSGQDTEAAPSPRLEVAITPVEWLRVHAGGSLNYQPAVYAFPAPGLTETSIDRGLQRSIQSELGAALTLPEDVRIEATLFLNRFDHVLLYENVWGWQPPRCDGEICRFAAPARSEVLAYGGELMVRRTAERGLSGWLAYTLAWNDAWSENGRPFVPRLDLRHVLNLVASYRFDFGLVLGTRAFVRSGFPGGTPLVVPDEAGGDRLPPAAYVDARVGWEWDATWAELEVYAEFINVTFTKESMFQCDVVGTMVRCGTVEGPAVFAPNAGFRATFR